VLIPTPSAYPYGYSTWAGGASVGEVCLKANWADDDVELLVGAVWASGCWVAVMLWLSVAVSGSMCWLLVWAVCGMVVSGFVDNGGVR
jgi:hypothetical protein